LAGKALFGDKGTDFISNVLVPEIFVKVFRIT
jgi:hypothetical protein